jgi:hypothetical protein
LEGLGIENVGVLGIFYNHLVCFVPIWYILLPFGIFCDNFFPVLVYCTETNLATLRERVSTKKRRSFSPRFSVGKLQSRRLFT